MVLRAQSRMPTLPSLLLRGTSSVPPPQVAQNQTQTQAPKSFRREKVAPAVATKFEGLDHSALEALLREQGKKLPSLPQAHFMRAWLQAAEPVIAELPIETWVLADLLGARPGESFLREFAVAATKGPAHARGSQLRLQRKWGTDLETMKPFLKVWEDEEIVRLEKTGFLEYDAVEMMEEFAYAPSTEYVEAWVMAAIKHLPWSVKQLGFAPFSRLLVHSVSLPVEDIAPLLPLLDQLVTKIVPLREIPEKSLVKFSQGLADLGYQFTEEGFSSYAALLHDRLPFVEQSLIGTLLRPLSWLADPVRDVKAVTPFVQTWAQLAAPQLKTWHRSVLISSLAALVRLQVGPRVIGIEWFRAWLEASCDYVEGSCVMQSDCSEAELLQACRKTATEMFWPEKLSDRNQSKRAFVAVRQLCNMQTLEFNDAAKIQSWVVNALTVGRFRQYQVKRVSRLLRQLGAVHEANVWDECSARGN